MTNEYYSPVCHEEGCYKPSELECYFCPYWFCNEHSYSYTDWNVEGTAEDEKWNIPEDCCVCLECAGK